MIQPELHKAFEITFDQSSKQNEKGGRTILNSAGSTISSPMFTWAERRLTKWVKQLGQGWKNINF